MRPSSGKGGVVVRTSSAKKGGDGRKMVVMRVEMVGKWLRKVAGDGLPKRTLGCESPKKGMRGA